MKYVTLIIGVFVGLLMGLLAYSEGVFSMYVVVTNFVFFSCLGFIIGNSIDVSESTKEHSWFLYSLIALVILSLVAYFNFSFSGEYFYIYGITSLFILLLTIPLLIWIRYDELSLPLLLTSGLLIYMLLIDSLGILLLSFFGLPILLPALILWLFIEGLYMVFTRDERILIISMDFLVGVFLAILGLYFLVF
ncbi:MAG: hypothetical protein ACI83O_000432 [Patescibacteria group bacterium]|jgi:hypothetical protein